MNRLLPIEGLRAYLAIWVLVSHVMFFSVGGISAPPGSGMRTSLVALVGSGPYAVNIFMIISGFVIFFLLDKKRESYGQFILRRFFRLYPVYILLLIAAIVLGPWEWRTFELSRRYMTPFDIDYYTRLSQATWRNWDWNILLHLGMLQGALPQNWLKGTTAYSFVIAAWSVAVEWQFYLLAPLVYIGIVKTNPIYRWLLGIVGVGLYFAVRHGHQFETVVPIFFPFFFVGIASYFIYKALPVWPPDTIFPLTSVLAVFIYVLSHRQADLIPIVLWIPFFGLLCESPASVSGRLFLRFFNHGAMQFLGAISYGIYLSHELVIMAVQYVLATLVPEQGEGVHFAALLFCTLLGTILVAALLHCFVEVPGMDLGRRLASRIKASPLGLA